MLRITWSWSAALLACLALTRPVGARAEEASVIYTDQGWYRVEGTPPPGPAGELQVISAPPPSPAPATQPTPASPAVPSGGLTAVRRPYAPGPRCLAERGSLIRRALELHGVASTDIDPTDEELGRLSAREGAFLFHRPFGPPPFIGVEPDRLILDGDVPIPPGAYAFDWDFRARADALIRCRAGER